MDEKDKKIKELEDQLKAKDAEVATVKESVTSLEKAVKEKDQIIEIKNQDIIGARKSYKKLSEMTQEEKDAMSEKEKELQARQEEFEAKQATFEQQQKDQLQKEVNYRRSEAIRRASGNNPEIAKKIEANFERLKDSDKAQTPDEIAKYVGDAYNLIGTDRPNPIKSAINGEGAAPEGSTEKTDFSETQEGKDLAGVLNIPLQTPAEAKAAGAN